MRAGRSCAPSQRRLSPPSASCLRAGSSLPPSGRRGRPLCAPRCRFCTSCAAAACSFWRSRRPSSPRSSPRCTPFLRRARAWAAEKSTPQRAVCSSRRLYFPGWVSPASSPRSIPRWAPPGSSFQLSAFLTIAFSKSTTRKYMPAARMHRITVALITRSSLNTCPPYTMR